MVQALTCKGAINGIPPQNADSWDLSIDPMHNGPVDFFFWLNPSNLGKGQHLILPTDKIDFQVKLFTTFEMGVGSSNGYQVSLLNNRPSNYTGQPPTMSTFMYTIYWGNSLKEAIYQKTWFLSNYDACSTPVIPTGDTLDYKHGDPKAVLTYYFCVNGVCPK